MQGLPLFITQQRHIELGVDHASFAMQISLLDAIAFGQAIQQTLHRIQIQFQVVWMRQLLKRRSEQRRPVIAQHFAEFVVDCEKTSFQAHQGHPDRRLLEDQIETPLTLL